MADRDVTVDVLMRDKTGPAVRGVKRNMEGLDRSVRKVNEHLDDKGPIGRFTSRITAMAEKVTGKVNGIFDGFDTKAKAAFGLGLKAMLVAAVAGAPAIGAAIVAGMALGIGGGIIALGAAALLGGKKDRDKALADLAKAQERVSKAAERAKSGTAAAKRSLADATAALARAQEAVNNGKAFAALDAALNNVKQTLKDVGARAAMPLLKPLTASFRFISKLVKGLEPDLRGIFAAIAPVVPLLTNALGGVLVEVVRAIKASMPGVTAAFRGLASALPTVGKWIGQFIRTLLSNPKIIENTTKALTLLAAGPLKLLGPLLSGLNVIFGAQVNLARAYAIIGNDLWPKLVGWLDGGSGAVKRLKEAWGPLWTAIQNVWTKLKEFAGAKTDRDILIKFRELVDALKAVWGPLKNFLGTVWNEAWALVKRIWNEKIVPWWNGTAKPWLKAAFAAAMNEAVQMMKAKAKSELAKLPGAIIGGLASLPFKISAALVGGMASAGRRIGSALINGIVGAISGGKGRIGSAVSSAAAAAAAAVAGNFSTGAGSWAPAQTAARFAGGQSFAMAGGGTSRTGGPVEVTSNVSVSLDGKPFYDYVDRKVAGSEKRTAFRSQVGRR